MQTVETGTRAKKLEALVAEQGTRMVIPWTEESGFRAVDCCLEYGTGGSSDRTRGSDKRKGYPGVKLGLGRGSLEFQRWNRGDWDGGKTWSI